MHKIKNFKKSQNAFNPKLFKKLKISESHKNLIPNYEKN